MATDSSIACARLRQTRRYGGAGAREEAPGIVGHDSAHHASEPARQCQLISCPDMDARPSARASATNLRVGTGNIPRYRRGNAVGHASQLRQAAQGRESEAQDILSGCAHEKWERRKASRASSCAGAVTTRLAASTRRSAPATASCAPGSLTSSSTGSDLPQHLLEPWHTRRAADPLILASSSAVRAATNLITAVVRSRVGSCSTNRHPIARQSDIQLDGVGADLHRPPERSHRVLGQLRRGPPVGDHQPGDGINEPVRSPPPRRSGARCRPPIRWPESVHALTCQPIVARGVPME